MQIDANMLGQIEPVIVSAPTARNGVTLIQRLLNSSRKIIVFGENAMVASKLPEIVHTGVNELSAHSDSLKASRDRFLSGDSEYWSSDLWPDEQAFIRALLTSFTSLVSVYEQSARSFGFTRWGIKHPMDKPTMLGQLLALLPRARAIFVYRDPFEVIASAKSRSFVQDEAGVREYAENWSKNLQKVRDDASPRVLTLRHEDLAGPNAGQWIGRIEAHTGVAGIDPEVLSRRINTFGDPQSGGSYIEPTPLSDRERAIIEEVAGEALAAA